MRRGGVQVLVVVLPDRGRRWKTKKEMARAFCNFLEKETEVQFEAVTSPGVISLAPRGQYKLKHFSEAPLAVRQN